MLLFIPPNENAQCFGIFKSKRGANLCSHMAQWGVVNKKSNVSATSSYIYIYRYRFCVNYIFMQIHASKVREYKKTGFQLLYFYIILWICTIY